MASFFFFFALLSFSSVASPSPLRRSLHRPFFFPLDSSPPYPPPPPPQPQPNLPSSSSSSSSTPLTQLPPFFPTSASSPPPSPPPPPPPFLLTFPANISALLLPTSPSSSSSSTSASSRRRLAAVLLSVTLLAVALLFALSALILIRCRRRNAVDFSVDKSSHADGLRLVPPNTSSSSSDTVPYFSAGQPPYHASTSSSEFVHLGTLSPANPLVDVVREPAPAGHHSSTSAPGSYKKLGSPELRPLPPLPRVPTNFSGETTSFCNNNVGIRREETREEDGEDEFFSPRGSSSHRGSTGSPDLRPALNSRWESEFVSEFGSRSLNSRKATHPYAGAVYGYSRNSSLSSSGNVASLQMDSSSPEPILKFPAPTHASIPRAIPMNSPTLSSSTSSPQSDSETLKSKTFTSIAPITRPSRKLWPPPPPLVTPRRFWENPITPVHAGAPVASNAELQRTRSGGTSDNIVGAPLQPKSEPLHLDQVRAGSDRAMVWDPIKSTSFQVHEEVIETLFPVTSSTQKDSVLPSVPPLLHQGYGVLDAEKTQNIVVLLKSLNVGVDKVCESLMEGNVDSLGNELLESLLMMTPTEEEERKLIEVSNISLCPAEKFLKALLHVPFVFKRVDAMLYVAKFEAEAEHLRRSFETLKAACRELRNSKLSSKLLEVLLETCIRMDVGTSRDSAPAHKLDRLLNLVDVEGKDSRTSLLHAVVQEMARIEAKEISDCNYRTNESSLEVDAKRGLQIMSGLSEELANVKRAATMDPSILSDNVTKLADGIVRVEDILRLCPDERKDHNSGQSKFAESMKKFVLKASEEIAYIQAEEGATLLIARELTEYFLSDSSKEEANPFRVFLVVRDFLTILDNACEEVSRINDGMISGLSVNRPARAWDDGCSR